MVKVISNTEIICDEMTGSENRCEFFSLLANSQQCGSCPLVNLSEEYLQTPFYESLREFADVPDSNPDLICVE